MHVPNQQPVANYTHAQTFQNDPKCDHIKTLNVDIYASDYLADKELMRHRSVLDAHTIEFLNVHPMFKGQIHLNLLKPVQNPCRNFPEE